MPNLEPRHHVTHNPALNVLGAEYGLFRKLEDANISGDYAESAKYTDMITIRDTWARAMNVIRRPDRTSRLELIERIRQGSDAAVRKPVESTADHNINGVKGKIALHTPEAVNQPDPELADVMLALIGETPNPDLIEPMTTGYPDGTPLDITEQALFALEAVSRTKCWSALVDSDPVSFRDPKTHLIDDADYNGYMKDFVSALDGTGTATEMSDDGEQLLSAESNMIPISPLQPKFRNRDMFWHAGLQPVYVAVPKVDEAGRMLYRNESVMARDARLGAFIYSAFDDVTVGSDLNAIIDNERNIAGKNIRVAIRDANYEYVGISADPHRNAGFANKYLSTMSDRTGMSMLRWYCRDDREWMACDREVTRAWIDALRDRDSEHAVSQDVLIDRMANQRGWVESTIIPMIEDVTANLTPVRFASDIYPGQVSIQALDGSFKFRATEYPMTGVQKQNEYIGKVIVNGRHEYSLNVIDHNGYSVTDSESKSSYASAHELIQPKDKLDLMRIALGRKIDGIDPADVQKMIDLVPDSESYMRDNLSHLDNTYSALVSGSGKAIRYTTRKTSDGQSFMESQIPLRAHAERTQYEYNGKSKNRYGVVVVARVRDSGNRSYIKESASVNVNEQRVRNDIESARRHFANMVDLDTMVGMARDWIAAEDKSTAPRPDFSRDGSTGDSLIDDMRRQYWDVLIGKAEDVDQPFDDLTDPEIVNYRPVHIAVQDANDPAVGFGERVQVLDETLNNFINRYIGTFEPTADNSPFLGFDPVTGEALRNECTFNPARVIKYMEGLGDISNKAEFLSACRACNKPGEPLVVDPALMRGDFCDDGYANRLRDQLTPFSMETSISYAELLARKEALGDDLSPIDAYRIEILDAVYTAAQDHLMNMTPDSVRIDEFGTVQYDGYLFDSQVSYTIDNGVVQPGPARPVSYTMGRFALPGSAENMPKTPLSDELMSSMLVMRTPYSKPYVITPPTQADILPSSLTDGHGNLVFGPNTDRIDRTRGVSFTEHLRRDIARQVAADTMSDNRKVDVVGSVDSMHRSYSSDYTGPHNDLDAFKDAVMSADLYFHSDNVDEHQLEALNNEALLALIETRNAGVRYSADMYNASVTTEIRENTADMSKAQHLNDRRRDAFTRADKVSMGVMGEHESRLFDNTVTSDSKDQMRRRATAVGAKLFPDRAPELSDTGMSRAAQLSLFSYADCDAWNRKRMGIANVDHSVRVDEANVVMCSGGGWTQDDCMVVSSDFATRNPILGASGDYRALRVGDKISDLHGNKGVISAVVDPTLSAEDVRRIERGFTDADGVRHPARPGYAQLVEMFAKNSDKDGCHIDVMMNAVATASRMNAGTLMEGLDSRRDGFSSDTVAYGDKHAFVDLDGEVHENSIMRMNIVVHDKAVDKQTNPKNNSYIGWQLAGSLERAPALLEEIYGNNRRAILSIREALRTSVGADLDETGRLHTSLIDHADEERNTFDIKYPVLSDPMYIESPLRHGAVPKKTVDGQVVVDANGRAEYEHGAWKPVGFLPDSAASAALHDIMSTVSEHGGFVPVPFELKWPEHRINYTDALELRDESLLAKWPRDAMGTAARFITIGGGSLSASAESDALGRKLFDMPIESVLNRASIEGAGETTQHEHSMHYEHILREAIEYNNLSVCVDAYKKEIDAICDAKRMGMIDDDTPIGVFNSRTLKPADKALTEYNARVEQMTRRMGDVQARAQKEFTKLATKAWEENFCGSNNKIKRRVMRCEIPGSTHCVWSGDPTCKVDHVRVGPMQAEKLGVRNGDMVALWRSPVLLPNNLCGLTVELDPTIDGVAINPSLACRIGGDFDGDKVSLYKPKSREARAELKTVLSLAGGLVNDRTEPMRTADGVPVLDVRGIRSITENLGANYDGHDADDAVFAAAVVPSSAADVTHAVYVTDMVRPIADETHILSPLSAGAVASHITKGGRVQYEHTSWQPAGTFNVQAASGVIKDTASALSRDGGIIALPADQFSKGDIDTYVKINPGADVESVEQLLGNVVDVVNTQLTHRAYAGELDRVNTFIASDAAHAAEPIGAFGNCRAVKAETVAKSYERKLDALTCEHAEAIERTMECLHGLESATLMTSRDEQADTSSNISVECRNGVPIYGLELTTSLDVRIGLNEDPELDRALTALTEQASLTELMHKEGSLDFDEYMKRNTAIKDGLDFVIRTGQRESLGDTPLDATDSTTLLQSVMDATVNPGAKGKAKNMQKLMLYAGMVPADVEAIENIKTPEAMHTWLENNAIEFGQEVGDDGRERLTLSDDAYIKLDLVRGDHDGQPDRTHNLDKLSDSAREMLEEGWRKWKTEVDESTMRAMDCKSNVTGLVGVFSQLYMLGVSDDKTLACELGQSVYQWSLDLKLDGEAAKRQVPWVDVCRNVMNGVYYDKIVNPSVDPDILATDLIPKKDTAMTTEEWVNAMENVMGQLGQDVNRELFEKLADKMVDNTGHVMGLDKLKARDGSVLERMCFDTSSNATEAALSIALGEKMFTDTTMAYAPNVIRANNGSEFFIERDRERFEGKVHALEPSDMQTGYGHAKANTRGYDEARRRGNPRVYFIHDPQADPETRSAVEDDILNRAHAGVGVRKKYDADFSDMMDGIRRSDLVVCTDPARVTDVHRMCENLDTCHIYSAGEGFRLTLATGSDPRLVIEPDMVATPQAPAMPDVAQHEAHTAPAASVATPVVDVYTVPEASGRKGSSELDEAVREVDRDAAIRAEAQARGVGHADEGRIYGED